MLKAFILLAILTVGMAAATAQDVKIKRGKVTMSEADYNVLKQKAELYEKTQQALNETLAAYQKQQQMNDMYRPIELKTFTDSASYAIGRDIYQTWLHKMEDEGIILDLKNPEPTLDGIEAVYMPPTLPSDAPIAKLIADSDVKVLTNVAEPFPAGV